MTSKVSFKIGKVATSFFLPAASFAAITSSRVIRWSLKVSEAYFYKTMLRKYPHNPTHLFLDDQTYFITAACYKKQPLLRHEAIQSNLLDTVLDFAERIGWIMDNWVILDNHYHFSAKSKQGKDLSYLMGNVHMKTGKYIRKRIKIEVSTVWWNYWGYCPRHEQDYFQHLNYMLFNPVKHKYVTDLKDYQWSSFQSLFDEIGADKLTQQFRHYGYRDLRIDFEQQDNF